MRLNKQLKEKIQESMASVLPITAIVFLVDRWPQLELGGAAATTPFFHISGRRRSSPAPTTPLLLLNPQGPPCVPLGDPRFLPSLSRRRSLVVRAAPNLPERVTAHARRRQPSGDHLVPGMRPTRSPHRVEPPWHLAALVCAPQPHPHLHPSFGRRRARRRHHSGHSPAAPPPWLDADERPHPVVMLRAPNGAL